MFSTAEKTNHAATVVRQKSQQQTFFRKAEDEVFFGNSEKSSFFSNPVQAKLSVSSPDDPQEKEADAVAETVMRMPDPEIHLVSGSSEEKIDKQEEEEEEIQTKTDSSTFDKINRQEVEEEEELQTKIDVSSINKINRQASEEEEELQTKQMSSVFRKSDESFDQFADTLSDDGMSETINRKKSNKNILYLIHRSGRGPPRNPGSFEQKFTFLQRFRQRFAGRYTRFYGKPV